MNYTYDTIAEDIYNFNDYGDEEEDPEQEMRIKTMLKSKDPEIKKE